MKGGSFLTKENVLFKLDKLASELLKKPLECNFNQILELLASLESFPGMQSWILRISWGMKNDDPSFLRDCILYGIRPLVQKNCK